MGLDMYLNRMPRYKHANAADVSAVEHYLDWMKAKEKGSEHANCTFEEWCGIKEIPKKEYIDFYSPFYKTSYSAWDTEKKYGYDRIMEQVGYWRKANHIHNWFVENVQEGEDDCRYHEEVTKETLEWLLDVCNEVLDSASMTNGVLTAMNSRIARESLPTQCGFFFGSTDYGEYYVEDIKNTIDIITKVLETTDFETQMIYYVSSW